MDLLLKDILERLKERFSLEMLSPEIKAVSIFGSFARGTFNERSDIDIFFVVKGDGISKEEEINYHKQVKAVLDELERDITLMVIPHRALETTDNWYILRLASEGIIVFDRGSIHSLFKKIIDAAKQSGLVEEERRFFRNSPSEPGKENLCSVNPIFTIDYREGSQSSYLTEE